MSRRSPETALQILICQAIDRIRLPGVIYWHTPNEGKRSWREAENLNLMGLLAGVPDLVFVRPDGVTFFLEVKTPKGTLSDSQQTFRDRVLSGTRAGWAVVRSVPDALAQLREWKLVN